MSSKGFDFIDYSLNTCNLLSPLDPPRSQIGLCNETCKFWLYIGLFVMLRSYDVCRLTKRTGQFDMGLIVSQIRSTERDGERPKKEREGRGHGVMGVRFDLPACTAASASECVWDFNCLWGVCSCDLCVRLPSSRASGSRLPLLVQPRYRRLQGRGEVCVRVCVCVTIQMQLAPSFPCT